MSELDRLTLNSYYYYLQEQQEKTIESASASLYKDLFSPDPSISYVRQRGKGGGGTAYLYVIPIDGWVSKWSKQSKQSE